MSARGEGRRPALVGFRIVGGLLAVFLALPVLVLLLRALLEGSLVRAALDPAILSALAVSLFTTAVSLLLIVALGTPLAYALARGRVRANALVTTLVDLPIILPPSVAGLALLLLLGRRGPLGGVLAPLGLEVAFTTAAVVLAQVFVAAPYFVRAARSGFAALSAEIEDSARVDGAGEWATFRTIALPLAAGSIEAGAVLAWARALGEFGATIMFAGNVTGRTQTLPLLVYSEFQSSLDASIAAASILVLAAIGILIGFALMRRRTAADLA